MTLFNLFPRWYSSDGGIFHLLTDINIPIFENTFTLNVGYFTRSGEKSPSTLLTKSIENAENFESGIEKVAELIKLNYSAKWIELYKSLSIEDKLATLNEIYSETIVNDATTATTGEETKTANDIDSVYPFDTDVKADKNELTQTSNNNTSNTAVEESNEKRDYTRKGFNSSLVDEIQKEINLLNFNLIERIYSDIDNLLTLPFYDF